MKKTYEKDELIIITTFVFLIVVLILLLNLFSIRYRTYKVVDAIVINDKHIEVILMEEEYKLLKNSHYLYIDNKRYKKEITFVEKNVLKRNKKYYHEIILRVKLPNKYKDNDVLRITIYNNKEKVINIFKSCWKE